MEDTSTQVNSLQANIGTVSDSQAQASRDIANLQRRTALLDNVSQIPPFSGEGSSIALEEFLEAFDNLASLLNWDEQEKKFVLSVRLTGAASKIYRANKHKSFEMLVNALKERFIRVDSPDVALSNFLNFKQTPQMRVQEFYDMANDLSHKALVVEGIEKDVAEKSRTAMLHSMLLSNLSPQIRIRVIARDPKTPREVLHLALLEEKALHSVSPISATGLYEAPMSTFSPPPAQQPQNLACAALPTSDLTQKEEIKDLQQKLTLLTEKFDQFLSIQPHQNKPTPQSNRIFCNFCNRPGHTDRNCFKRPYFENFNYEPPQQHQSGRGRSNYRGNRPPREDFRDSYYYDNYDNYQYDRDSPNYRNRGERHRGGQNYQNRPQQHQKNRNNQPKRENLN